MSVDDLFAGDESPPPPSSYPDSSHCSPKEEVLIRLETEGVCPVLYTLVQCKEQAFSIHATDGDNAWVGDLSHAKLKEMAEMVKIDFEELLKMSQKALTGEQIEGIDFLYATSLVDEDKMKLVWKKQLASGGIKVVLGSVVLPSCEPHQAFCRMLDHAMAKMAELEVNIEELEAEKERLLRERTVILQRLDKCVSDKEDLESNLYGKFKLVLDEKKAKIRRLMEALTHLSTQQQQEKSKEPTNSSRREVDSEDESSIATNEVSGTPSPKSKQPATTSAANEGISSLLRNDWQDDRTSPPVKRRKREPRKKPAGRLEIPPLLSSSSGGRRFSRRRSESVESEELLTRL